MSAMIIAPIQLESIDISRAFIILLLLIEGYVVRCDRLEFDACSYFMGA